MRAAGYTSWQTQVCAPLPVPYTKTRYQNPMKLKVWTEAYRPFILGGDVNAPIMTEIECGNPIAVGKGVNVVEIISPHGTVHIAECTTGALVGTSLFDVRQDIEFASEKIIEEQLSEGKKRVKKATIISAERFWELLNHSS